MRYDIEKCRKNLKEHCSQMKYGCSIAEKEIADEVKAAIAKFSDPNCDVVIHLLQELARLKQEVRQLKDDNKRRYRKI